MHRIALIATFWICVLPEKALQIAESIEVTFTATLRSR